MPPLNVLFVSSKPSLLVFSNYCLFVAIYMQIHIDVHLYPGCLICPWSIFKTTQEPQFIRHLRIILLWLTTVIKVRYKLCSQTYNTNLWVSKDKDSVDTHSFHLICLVNFQLHWITMIEQLNLCTWVGEMP